MQRQSSKQDHSGWHLGKANFASNISVWIDTITYDSKKNADHDIMFTKQYC